jgi:hypothetical protein
MYQGSALPKAVGTRSRTALNILLRALPRLCSIRVGILDRKESAFLTEKNRQEE